MCVYHIHIYTHNNAHMSGLQVGTSPSCNQVMWGGNSSNKPFFAVTLRCEVVENLARFIYLHVLPKECWVKSIHVNSHLAFGKEILRKKMYFLQVSPTLTQYLEIVCERKFRGICYSEILYDNISLSFWHMDIKSLAFYFASGIPSGN